MNSSKIIKIKIPIEDCVNEVVYHPDCTVEFLKQLVIELNEIIKLNETNE